MEAKTQGYGTIGWAMSALKYGHKMRRPGWPPDVYVDIDTSTTPHTIVIHNVDEVPDLGPGARVDLAWEASQPDLMALDWQYADPVLPGTYRA